MGFAEGKSNAAIGIAIGAVLLVIFLLQNRDDLAPVPVFTLFVAPKWLVITVTLPGFIFGYLYARKSWAEAKKAELVSLSAV